MPATSWPKNSSVENVADNPPVVWLIFWLALTVPFEFNAAPCRTEVGAVIVVAEGAQQVHNSITVDVADGRHRSSERSLSSSGASGKFGESSARLHRAVDVEERDVHRATVEASIVVPVGADGDVADSVAV
ncbi:MAG: hypothetical protein R2710_00020 [Acidimicrobiales bacterium]